MTQKSSNRRSPLQLRTSKVYLRERTYPILALATAESDPLALPNRPVLRWLPVIAVSCGAEFPLCGHLLNLLA